VRQSLGPAFCLRHSMQHFIENYIYYMMFEVSAAGVSRQDTQACVCISFSGCLQYGMSGCLMCVWCRSGDRAALV
jgi:hypothetical protein